MRLILLLNNVFFPLENISGSSISPLQELNILHGQAPSQKLPNSVHFCLVGHFLDPYYPNTYSLLPLNREYLRISNNFFYTLEVSIIQRF